jgi:hypothetical protein
MRRLPLDERGYPVPWFVQWIDGRPEFRAMSREKWVKAVHERRCWVCGDYLGAYLSYVIGPMCGINRTTSEPACHKECAVWSAKNCPFLSRPTMVRREDAFTDGLKANVAGIMQERNPGVTLVWTTKTYEIFNDGKGKPLIAIGEPVSLLWFFQGRTATRAEIIASVESGFPALYELAEKQEKEDRVPALRELAKVKARFEALYPA